MRPENLEAGEKFDYYVLGLATAALAFEINATKPPMPREVLWMWVFSWSFLTIATVAGLAVLGAWLGVRAMDEATSKFNDEIQTLRELGSRGVTPLTGSSAVLPRRDPVEFAGSLIERIPAQEADAKGASSRLQRIGKWLVPIRDISFLAGFGVAALAKIMELP